jgi:hypothetical protein
LEEAIAAAQDRYGNATWDSLTVSQQAAAIYEEMRRIDCERAAPSQRSGKARRTA